MSSVTSFVGQIPELYERHLGPVLFEPYARDLAARLPHDTRRVLELASGTGRVTRHLLAALPADGELVATDLNESMIAEGRVRPEAVPVGREHELLAVVEVALKPRLPERAFLGVATAGLARALTSGRVTSVSKLCARTCPIGHSVAEIHTLNGRCSCLG